MHDCELAKAGLGSLERQLSATGYPCLATHVAFAYYKCKITLFTILRWLLFYSPLIVSTASSCQLEML